MTEFPVDIILPVWNSPEETRSCLVNLAAHSPQARIVLVDNGSDRETERLLEEFAEILGQRALLVRTDTNIGFVRAANRGLARGEAEFLALVRHSTQVSAGWLAPLLSQMSSEEDSGVVIPHLAPLEGKSKVKPVLDTGAVEIDHPSFAALMVRKTLYDRIGGFDESLDADLWCLKDYCRRAWRAGMRTFAVATPPVAFRVEIPMGSVERRQARVVRSAVLYRERWGEELDYCVSLPATVDAAALLERLPLLLEGARQGHRFTIFLSSRLYKELGFGNDRRHDNITWSPLPFLFWSRRRGAEMSRLISRLPEIVFVQWEGEQDLAGRNISYAALEELIGQRSSRYYNR